ncbi:hypothetical protein CIHG_03059 [Coccidioides immitis H538.4]|uniref:Uncharacterized protein n=1 Tax=Coccidioides immitis H538.4 TaxID=396776 RepID=A0A0J8RJG0_COCIT|nr:hypothetical protein CIHG_03059 [Coccidioides immitis H538.4]
MESRRPSYLALSDFPRVFPTSLGYRVVTWLHTYGANWLTSLGDEIDRDGSMINFAARRHANAQQKSKTMRECVVTFLRRRDKHSGVKACLALPIELERVICHDKEGG